MAASKKEVKKAKEMAAAGKSAAQIERKTGVSANRASNLVTKAAATRSAATTAGSTTPTTPVRTTPTPSRSNPGTSFGNTNSVRGAVQALGANGNLSGKELLKISNKFDVDQSKVIRQLDKVNAKKDLTIGLGSGAVKRITKNSGKDVTSLLGLNYGINPYGSGKIGTALGNYVKATGPEYKNAGVSQSAAGLIPLQGGAYQIDAKGNYSPKVSNKMFGSPTPTPDPKPTPTLKNGGVDDHPDPIIKQQEPVATLPAELPPEEDPLKDPGAGMMSGGGLGATGANKLGRAKGRLRKLGIYGRGTALLGRGLQYGNALNA